MTPTKPWRLRVSPATGPVARCRVSVWFEREDAARAALQDCKTNPCAMLALLEQHDYRGVTVVAFVSRLGSLNKERIA